MASIRILTHNTLNGPRNCLSGSLPTTRGFANLPESFSILDLVGCLYYLCLVMSVLFTLSLCSSKVDLSNPDEFRFKRSFNEMIRTWISVHIVSLVIIVKIPVCILVNQILCKLIIFQLLVVVLITKTLKHQMNTLHVWQQVGPVTWQGPLSLNISSKNNIGDILWIYLVGNSLELLTYAIWMVRQLCTNFASYTLNFQWRFSYICSESFTLIRSSRMKYIIRSVFVQIFHCATHVTFKSIMHNVKLRGSIRMVFTQ